MDDRLREAIERELVVERSGWAAERATRVTSQLQRDLAPSSQLETLVVWSASHGAFTAAGRTVYISRRLLERLPDDDAAAFVIAHELAHHRLGHVPGVTLARLPVQLAISLLRRLIAGVHNERQADLLAIELCIDAGYDPDRCIVALEILDQIALDYGDVDGSLGDVTLRGRSHPAVRDRISAVRAHVEAVRRGQRLVVDTPAQRARRKRVAMTIAGGVALTAVLVLLRRRWPGA